MTRHTPRVRAVALRLTRDEQIAHELTHEAFVRMHGALASFDGRSTLATWLHRVVVNLCRDWARRRGRDRTVTLDNASTMPTTLTSPDVAAEAADRVRVVDGIVQALPAPLRETVVLRYAGGLTYAEIAEVLDCEVGTVASRMHRALRALGTMLETRGIQEDSL